MLCYPNAAQFHTLHSWCIVWMIRDCEGCATGERRAVSAPDADAARGKWESSGPCLKALIHLSCFSPAPFSSLPPPPSAALYPGPSLWDGRLSRKSQKRPVGKMESLRSLEHKGWGTQEKAWEREERGGKEGSGGCCMAKQPDWDMQEASNPGRWVLRRAVTSAQSGKSNPVSKLLKRVTERPERRRTESRRNYTEHQSRAAM